MAAAYVLERSFDSASSGMDRELTSANVSDLPATPPALPSSFPRLPPASRTVTTQRLACCPADSRALLRLHEIGQATEENVRLLLH